MATTAENRMIDSFVWSEVYLRKTNERYLDKYLDKLKSCRIWIQALTLGCALSGFLGFVFHEYAPFIAIGAICAIQCYALIRERVFMPDADLIKVMDLRIMNINCLNKFEKLFLKIYYDMISKEDAVNEIFQIRGEFIDIHKHYNTLNLPPNDKYFLEAGKEAKEYLDSYFNLSSEEVEAAAGAKNPQI